MHKTHAILIKADEPNTAVHTLQQQALAAIEPYAGQVYDYCLPLAPQECVPAEEIPGVVVRGTDPRLLPLVERWATRPLALAQELIERGTRGRGPSLPLTAATLARLWEEEDPSVAGDVAKAFNLVAGLYTFDSEFYSAPDGRPKLRAATRAALQASPERFALVFLNLYILSCRC